MVVVPPARLAAPLVRPSKAATVRPHRGTTDVTGWRPSVLVLSPIFVAAILMFFDIVMQLYILHICGTIFPFSFTVIVLNFFFYPLLL